MALDPDDCIVRTLAEEDFRRSSDESHLGFKPSWLVEGKWLPKGVAGFVKNGYKPHIPVGHHLEISICVSTCEKLYGGKRKYFP
jgi:hypothetical protein